MGEVIDLRKKRESTAKKAEPTPLEVLIEAAGLKEPETGAVDPELQRIRAVNEAMRQGFGHGPAHGKR